MLSKLQQGTTLVVDRYSFSGAVFTAAKKVPGLDLEWCKVAFSQEPLTTLISNDVLMLTLIRQKNLFGTVSQPGCLFLQYRACKAQTLLWFRLSQLLGNAGQADCCMNCINSGMPFMQAPERGLPAPDRILYLNLEVAAAAARGGFGVERYEKKEMQYEVTNLIGNI